MSKIVYGGILYFMIDIAQVIGYDGFEIIILLCSSQLQLYMVHPNLLGRILIDKHTHWNIEIL